MGTIAVQLLKEVWWNISSWENLRNTLSTTLYVNAIYLMANAMTHAGLGFVFWLFAARIYSAEVIGLGSALLSAATLLSYISSLGVGMSLIRFIPTSTNHEARKLVNSSFILCSLVGIISAAIFLAGLPLWSPALSFVRQNHIFLAAMMSIVVVTTVLERLAEVFIAIRRAGFVLLHYVIANITKVTLVVFLARYFQVFSIVTSVLLGIVVTLIIGIFFTLPRVLPGYRLRPEVRALFTQDRFSFSFTNYIGLLSWNAPQWILPIMVANLLGAESNAFFYITWAIAMVLFSIPYSVSNSLFAEGSHSYRELKVHVIKAFKFTLILIPAVALIFIFGGKILSFFGRQYAETGKELLWILSPTTIPLAINTIYLGIARVRKNLRDIFILPTVVALSSLVLSYFLIPYFGIIGPGIGWLASNTAVAFIVLPKIFVLLRSEDTNDMMEP